jgi:sulfide:quinone oxidoreductase
MLPLRPLRVVVAGGGFAAGEALLALRALAGDRVDLELVTPDRRLAVRPLATSAVFDGGAVQTFDLGELAESVGARLRDDAVRAVAPAARRLSLTSGATVDYDALVLAVGARARVGVPGAVTFRDQRDIRRVQALVEQLEAGTLHHLVLTAPAGVTWPLPLYELALYAGGVIDDRGLAAQLTVVTGERAPLEGFGAAASEAVSDLLRDRGVRVVTTTSPRLADRDGLHLVWGGTIAADAVVAVPVLSGRRLPGIPANFAGFVPIDARGRVEGRDRVWAAGDMTDWPIKQGGLAAQQAEVAAADIAELAGAGVAPDRGRPVLRAKLLGADAPLYLRAELDRLGRPAEAGAVVSPESPWWPAAKVFGRHLTPWMADQTLEQEVPV